jgi:hypothetical protein
MVKKEQIKAVLTELVLNTTLDIEQVEREYEKAFVQESAEVLGECWIEVMSELEELN